MGSQSKYVKLDDFEYLHSTLTSLSDSCSSVSTKVTELGALEKEKYKLFAEAKKLSRGLTSDLKAVKRDMKEPKKPTVSPKPVKKKKPTPKAKPKKVAKRKKVRKKVETSKRVVATSEDLEELKRLKSNLDAIRSSLK